MARGTKRPFMRRIVGPYFHRDLWWNQLSCGHLSAESCQREAVGGQMKRAGRFEFCPSCAMTAKQAAFATAAVQLHG
jgi:hypothetical protein